MKKPTNIDYDKLYTIWYYSQVVEFMNYYKNNSIMQKLVINALRNKEEFIDTCKTYKTFLQAVQSIKPIPNFVLYHLIKRPMETSQSTVITKKATIKEIKLFVHTPKAVKDDCPGDRLFVCISKDSDRYYLAWKCNIVNGGYTHPKTGHNTIHTLEELIELSKEWTSIGAAPSANFKKDSYYTPYKLK